MNYALAFENKYTKNMNYAFEYDNSISVTNDKNKAKKFNSRDEGIKWYTENYYRLKSHSNIYGWKTHLGIDVDEPYFIEI